MTAFVVLAAGRGSRLGRIGDELPKCLLPLNGRAVISHQLALAPIDARVIVVTGYRHNQVQEYLRLMHPERDVTLVHEPEWGRGPGASLLEALPIVGDDDMIFVACDTLWERYDDVLDEDDGSWVAVAPVPAGTPAVRWCRVTTDVSGVYVDAIYDKRPDVVPFAHCWTALAKIARADLATFWSGLRNADHRAGEIQLSSGLDAVVARGEPVGVRYINWLDVGDEQAFRQAAASVGGYDPLKPDQITYVLPPKVVKFHLDRTKIRDRITRAKLLGDAVPQCVESFNGTMTAYDYVPGQLAYDAVDRAPSSHTLRPLLSWWQEKFWITRLRYAQEPPPDVIAFSDKFYRDKTFRRVMALDPPLRNIALDAITRIDWDKLIDGVVPGVFHGDFTLANVVTWDGDDGPQFRAIDWREDYAGIVEWGDLRYDLAKLLTSAKFHWHRASYGDFRRWEWHERVETTLNTLIMTRFPELNIVDLHRIAALCLLNSAVLHAAPMDEILVARGAHWLETLT